MSLKRKLVFLPSKHSEVIVDIINSYFNMGYEIDDILNADDGYYILLILNDNENYGYKHVSKFVDNNNCDLIEENDNHTINWVKSTTGDIVFNTSTNDLLN